MRWPDTKACIAGALILLFALAYAHDPDDDTLKGALIGAFAAAWGYYLGSSKGASENRDTLNAIATKTTDQRDLFK